MSSMADICGDCGKCGSGSSLNTAFITCDGRCGRSFHIGACADGLTEQAVKLIREHVSVRWFCKFCTGALPQQIAPIEEIESALPIPTIKYLNRKVIFVMHTFLFFFLRKIVFMCFFSTSPVTAKTSECI